MSIQNLDFFLGRGIDMETIDIIKELCAKKSISISQLENALEYGNGSIAKSKNMSVDRAYQIAKFFNVPMEYLMTGKTVDGAENEIALLRQQQSILMEINKINSEISTYYKKIADCQNQLVDLKREYLKLDSKKGEEKTSIETSTPPNDDPNDSIFDAFMSDLPFA